VEAEIRVCQNCKTDFVIEPDDFGFYEKIKVPPPTFCFDCRLQRKLAYINERTLFKRKCDKCKKSIISVYSSEAPHVVWCTDCYNSNEKQELEYAVNYDFSRPFFEQFYDLLKKVPRLHIVHKNNNAEDCEYANYTYRSKNVYLSSSVIGSEDIYYSKQVMRGNKICLDSMNIRGNERGYELIDSNENYNSRFLVRSNQCVDSFFLLNCRNCTDCFMSTNQQNKSYVFRNEQLSREAYVKKIADLNLNSHSAQKDFSTEFEKLSQSSICRFAIIKNSTNCTGNFIENSKNVHHSFDLIESEDAKYITYGVNKMNNSYDLIFTGKLDMSYEVANSGAGDYKVLFSLDIGASQDISYSISCNNSHNLFGCIGLYGKEYCILNKKYTKEEYSKLLPKIIQHMNEMPYVDGGDRVYKYGEFFPTELAPYAYNESSAFEGSPLSKAKTIEEGYVWRDFKEKQYETTIESKELSDKISDVKNSILSEIIACPNGGQVETKCTFAYRIMPDELRFYQLMKIPLPRLCPNCRYYERRKWKNPWKLWHRQCMCGSTGSPQVTRNHDHTRQCPNEFETSYAPERSEIVYCEKCYQAEVY